MADITFYSSVRRGATIAISRPDFSPAPGGDAGARASLAVKLSYTGIGDANTSLSLVGPGDIVGLDTRAIVRTFPRADESDAEGGFLCYLELDQIDLPWRYTPAKIAGTVPGSDRVRPWLFLLVLEEGTELSEVDFRAASGEEKLPQLTVRDRGLLPDLADAWAWAHVQSQSLLDEASMEQSLADRQGALVARLMSPRRMKDLTAYRAFLVPTFLRGVRAGRGEDSGSTDALEPAWNESESGPVTLPVYHSWRFQTGTVSSFDEAARLLRPSAALPESVGLRGFDVSEPGLGPSSPIAGPGPMRLGGALQSREQAQASEPTLSDAWINELGEFIDEGIQNLPDGTPIRVVTPPLYGRWYAAEAALDGATLVTNPPWFHRLNVDPRYRVAAALGTEVVQRDQQALMAAAWDQAERLQEVNRARRVLQTGREVFTRLLTRHLDRGPVTTRFSSLSPVFSRVLSCLPGTGPKPTIAGVLDGTPFHGRLTPAFRRRFPGDATQLIDVINTGGFVPVPSKPDGMNTPGVSFGGSVPGGLPTTAPIISGMTADERLYWGVVVFWVARKLLVSDGGKYWWLLRKLLRFGLDLIQLGSTQGATNIALAEKLRAGTLTPADMQAAPSAPGFVATTRDPDFSNPATWPAPRVATSTGSLTEANAFRDAAAALLGYVNATPAPGPTLKRLDVAALLTCLRNALAPAESFVAHEKTLHVLTRTIAWQAQDQLEPILLAPGLGHPMWRALRDLSPEWILPGLGAVPKNTVSLVKTNQRFIEAFMTGLNHEMTRELLWNGYPTDQRGTYFHQFWDFAGWTAGAGQSTRSESAFADIRPLATWQRTSALGSHSGRPGTDHLVLLVRGDVIRRYPNAVVYASKASTAGIDDATQRYPVFQAVLAGDIAYFGFELDTTFSEGSVRGDGSPGSGWYFVLQEHPSEPRFNRNEGASANVTVEDYLDEDTHLPPAVAADLASRAYDLPLRVAFRGRDLLPAT